MSGFNIYLTEKEWNHVNLGLDLIEAEDTNDIENDSIIIEKIRDKQRISVLKQELNKERLRNRKERIAKFKRMHDKAQATLDEALNE